MDWRAQLSRLTRLDVSAKRNLFRVQPLAAVSGTAPGVAGESLSVVNGLLGTVVVRRQPLG